MPKPFTLFEISWEICNKVGGIHTVIATKAKTLVERFGDDYVAVGPWTLSDSDHDAPFEKEAGFEPFEEACREGGFPVRVGRWRIPGRPRTILVEFSGLYDQKDDFLARLWEQYEVDSISGSWDYVEPVLFGYAAGQVIETYWETYLAGKHRRAVAHAHEWMTGSAILHLKERLPAIGTVFTTHATMLGRALSSTGHSPEDGLGDREPGDLAEEHGVTSKHSLEGIAAREADAFTTVSEVTAAEARLLHEREPQPVTPNGIELDVVDDLAGPTPREVVRTRLFDEASRFFGEDVSDAVLLGVSGRYEFHNKGIDLLLDALARLNAKEGRRIVLLALIPAGNSGLKSELLDRRGRALEEAEGPVGISTHHLFEAEADPIHEHCQRVGLTNQPDARVRVMQVPIYLSEKDDWLQLPYLAVLRGMDLTCFPSYYEPWGYTPQESVAVGVPTITTDYAGFGRWARSAGLGPADGVHVLSRVHVHYDAAVESLVQAIEDFLREPRGAEELAEACRRTAGRTSWRDFVARYDQAYGAALEAVQGRLAKGIPQVRRPRTPLPLEPEREGHRPQHFTFEVAARIPEELEGLTRLARNYAWCWDHEAPRLFEELSPRAWKACGHNPRALLQRAYPVDLQARAADPAYLARLGRTVERLDAYVGRGPERVPASPSAENPIAYFCAEYGIHESLRIYSGGLGVLAGDHLKSASDLNLPFVAIGLFYRMGYMGQRLSPAGEQIAVDVPNEPRELAMELLRDDQGEPLEVTLNLPGRQLALRTWRVDVGRVPLYLLDADVESNRPEDRDLTRNLYGGDAEVRLKQEIILGRGGVRLVRALNLRPSVFHMNEGHSAFLTLERIGGLAHQEGLSFSEARELVRATTLFTTHTPVPAGHDRFSEELMRRYFSDVDKWLGIPWERFFALGRAGDDDDSFNMTHLALSCSSFCNGVSKLHQTASRELLQGYWPKLHAEELPVEAITNGVHLGTWTRPELGAALGAKNRFARPVDFTKVDGTAMPAVWAAKCGAKRALLETLRDTIPERGHQRGDAPSLLEELVDGLTEDALYIGFARRFAPYKRADLMFRDTERLKQLLNDEDRPVRIFVAGKAHPADGHGQDLVKAVAGRAREEGLAGRVYFLEDYDIDLARLLVQGVDVWLNNPLRMQEASGTSGMKAAANGTLNLSIGDGWWPEAYAEDNGWQIGADEVYADRDLQDEFDASSLYRLLEEEVVPAFFERDNDGLPQRWLARMRRCLATIPSQFSTDRMVGDYLRRAYVPLGASFDALSKDKRWRLRSLVQEKKRLKQGFAGVKFLSVEVGRLTDVKVGDSLEVRVDVELGSLAPDDVVVELVLGRPDGTRLTKLETIPLAFVQSKKEGHVFEAAHTLERSGSFGYGIRVRPKGEREKYLRPGDLMVWA